MKLKISATIAVLLLVPFIAFSTSKKAVRLTRQTIDNVIKELTIEEKIHLLTGVGMKGYLEDGSKERCEKAKSIVPGAAGATYPIERLNIPSIVLSDGPSGILIPPKRKNDTNTYYCTGFPVSTLIASTWDTDIAKLTGQMMGEEAIAYGIDVILGPGINILRNPLCGRNFEYYSEDPLLVGKTAAAMINGIQSKGVGTALKHFAANNQEINRLGNDSRISERALREIYLKGFEIAVKEAKPWTVMTSYNYLNGIYTAENHTLLSDILRGEWGFDGTVMSDWGAGQDNPAMIMAGTDLIEPGSNERYEAILSAYKKGEIPIAVIDQSVKRVLQLILRSHSYDPAYKPSNQPDFKKHSEIAQYVASEGMTLLKNRDNALPLSQCNVAVFGSSAYRWVPCGLGAANVNTSYTTDIIEGLTNAGYKINATTTEHYTPHIEKENERIKAISPQIGHWYSSFLRAKELPGIEKTINGSLQEADAAIIVIGRNVAEGVDRLVDNDFNLSVEEKTLISKVSKAYHKEGKKVIVVLNICCAIETASWRDDVDAILSAWLPGQEGGNAVADIILGKVNPSGHLTMSFPISYKDVPSQNFPVMTVTTGTNPSYYRYSSTKLYEVENVDYTNYVEDIYVGYRYYTTNNVAVAYPFGHGLSYTKFERSNYTVTPIEDGWEVKCTITNVGKVAGKELVQLYVSAPCGQLYLDKPSRELKGYQKTSLLQPGESTTVSIKVTIADLASFCEAHNCWIADAGEYIFSLADNAEDEGITNTITLSRQYKCKVDNTLAPYGQLFIK